MELLVVIGLIAMLIAMLMPALQKAQEHAWRVQCMNNHKQLMLATRMYAGDWNGVMPFPNWDGQEGKWANPGWLYEKSRVVWAPEDVETGQLWKYLGRREIYRCPFDPPPYPLNHRSHWVTSYCMNGAFSGYGGQLPPYKITQFKGDAIVFWEVDETRGIWNDGSNFPPESITIRHRSNKAAIVSCIDGRAEWITKDYYDWLEKYDRPGRLWCRPGTKEGR